MKALINGINWFVRSPHQSSVAVHVGEGAEKISAYRTRRVGPTEYRAGNSRPKSVGKITYNVK